MPVITPWLLFLPDLLTQPAPLGLLAALPPSDSQALQNMKRDILHISNGRTLWAHTKIFMQRYITLAADLPRHAPAWEKAVRAELDNSRLFDWLRSHADYNVRLVGALLDIHLAAMRYPGEINGVDTAIEFFKSSPQAQSDLLHIAAESSDFITTGAALDALKDLKATKELEEFTASLNLAHVTEDRLLPLLPLLGRVKPQEIDAWIEKPALDIAFEDRFLVSDPTLRQTGMRLLAGQLVPVDLAHALLAQLMDRPPEEENLNLHVMISMLAVLTIVSEGQPALISLSPERRENLYREITHVHWNVSKHLLKKPLNLGRIVHRLGELIHGSAHNDGEPTFMAYLFEMAFKDALGLLTFGNLSHPRVREDHFTRILQSQGSHINNPSLAAEMQFSGLIQAAIRDGKSSLPWESIYKFAVPWEKDGYTFSRIAFEIMANYLGPQALGQEHTMLREKRRAGTRAKSIFLTHQMFMTVGNKPAFQNVASPDLSEDELRKILRDYYIPDLFDPRHFNIGKTAASLVGNWSFIEARLFDRLLPSPPLRYLEIHPDQRCHNRCKYCRGKEEDPLEAAKEAVIENRLTNSDSGTRFIVSHGLRAVPEKEKWLSGMHMVQLVKDFQKMNPGGGGFIRISGSIGDPGKNPETWMLMQALNSAHIPWGITLDGLSISSNMMEEMFSPAAHMQWAHVSLDAGSNKTYVELKKNRAYVEPRPGVMGPYDVVMFNINRMLQQRKKTGSEGRVIVSVLIQSENYMEIEGLAGRLKDMHIDLFQIKMQHFDQRRMMPPSAIDYFYDTIKPKIEALEDKDFLLEFLPNSKAAARTKNEGQLLQIIRNKNTVTPVLASPIDFEYCAVQDYSRTISPDGSVNACCQVHDAILPSAGNIFNNSLQDILASERNAQISQMDPRGICNNCAPSDRYMNKLVSVLCMAARVNPLLVVDFKRRLFDMWHVELHQRARFRSDYQEPESPFITKREEEE